MNYQIAQVASNWWIEQMKIRCKYLYPHKIINKDSNLVVVDDSLSEDLSRFQLVLTDEIKCELEKYHYVSLTCYRLPNLLLSKIAQKAHISYSYFPIQAEMIISPKSIQVSLKEDDLHELPLSTGDL